MEQDPIETRQPWRAAAPHSPYIYIIQDLTRLITQSPTQITYHLLQVLAQTVEAHYGHIIFTDAEAGSVLSLVFQNDQIIKEPEKPAGPPPLQTRLADWAYRHGQRVLVSDADSDPRSASWQDLAEFKSALAVPISTDGPPRGAIALFSKQPQHFDDTDMVYVSSLCQFAAIIIENTHLHNQTAQTKKTINALGFAAQFINTYPDLDQTLTRLLHQLTLTLSIPYAMVLLYEDDRLAPCVSEGFAISSAASRTALAQKQIPAIFHVLQQERIVSSRQQDLAIEFTELGFPPSICDWIASPLISQRHALGLVILATPIPKAFTDQEQLVLESIAHHISIAIAHFRLQQETNRRLRELAFLNETGQAITSTLNLDRILRLLLDRVREILQINAVSIALRDAHTGELVFEAASGEGAAGVMGIRLSPGQGIAGWVAETGKPLVVPDVYQDARFYPDIDRKIGMRTRTILCVPIVLKGHVVGIIEALNPGDIPFDQHAADLLTALAGLAASAIENARLFARVQSAEARYESLFENNINPIIITDPKGIIVAINRNACVLLNRDKEGLLGANLTHIHSAEDELVFAAPLEKLRSEEIVVFQVNLVADGQRHKIEIQGQQVWVQTTPVIQWIGRDISAETELEQMRDDMVRMIIHDLRNPLANIMNSLDVLQDIIDEKDDSVSLEDLLHIAKRSGQRLHQLINSILDISRLETGQAILDTHVTDLAPLIQDAVVFMQPQAQIREIQLTTDVPAGLPSVTIDSDMISRVVLNLLDNAVKFTQVGGKVTVTARLTDNYIEIKIKDNGLGIPDDQLPHIFKKFVRVRQQNSPQGTGLGLAFCALAIKAHGGQIWAESQLGLGTTMTFLLPLGSDR